jgi:hypothetical protein
MEGLVLRGGDCLPKFLCVCVECRKFHLYLPRKKQDTGHDGKLFYIRFFHQSPVQNPEAYPAYPVSGANHRDSGA